MKRSLLFLILFLPCFVQAQSEMAIVKGGNYVPLFGAVGTEVSVSPFLMDVNPVTNQDFIAFVTENPKWRRSNVLRLYADKNYLKTWLNDTSLHAEQHALAPVTNISWFAATAYAKWKGKRLPTTDEWEFAAMASQDKIDARSDSLYSKMILAWYEKPKTFTNPIGDATANYWGINHLFGLVWEWTEDFNSVLITGESRGDVDANNRLFCGGGAVGANDLMNYAAFMRFAFKGSLKANYCVQNLGFRCVKDIES